MMVVSLVPRAILDAIFCAVAAVLVAHESWRPGLIAFQYDWDIPHSSSALAAWGFRDIHAPEPISLGSWFPYPVELFERWFAGVLGLCGLTGDSYQRLLFFGVPFGIALAIVCLGRRFAANATVRWPIAVIVAASPNLYDAFVLGYVATIVSIFATACFAVAAARWCDGERTAGLWLAVLTPLCLSDIHFLVFVPAIGTAMVLLTRASRRLAAGMAAIVGGAVVACESYVYIPFFAGWSREDLPQTSHTWLLTHEPSALSVLVNRSLDYDLFFNALGPSASPIFRNFAIGTVFVVLGAALAKRSSVLSATVGLALLFFVWAIAWSQWPFSAVYPALYAHFAVLALFRNANYLLFPFWFMVALLALVVVRGRWAVVLAASAALTCVPYVNGAFGGTLQHVRVRDQQIVRPQDSILTLPRPQPNAYDQSPRAGINILVPNDPYPIFQQGGREQVWFYDALAEIVDRNAHAPYFAGLLGLGGVNSVVMLQNLASQYASFQDSYDDLWLFKNFANASLERRLENEGLHRRTGPSVDEYRNAVHTADARCAHVVAVDGGFLAAALVERAVPQVCIADAETSGVPLLRQSHRFPLRDVAWFLPGSKFSALSLVVPDANLGWADVLYDSWWWYDVRLLDEPNAVFSKRPAPLTFASPPHSGTLFVRLLALQHRTYTVERKDDAGHSVATLRGDECAGYRDVPLGPVTPADGLIHVSVRGGDTAVAGIGVSASRSADAVPGEIELCGRSNDRFRLARGSRFIATFAAPNAAHSQAPAVLDERGRARALRSSAAIDATSCTCRLRMPALRTFSDDGPVVWQGPVDVQSGAPGTGRGTISRTAAIARLVVHGHHRFALYSAALELPAGEYEAEISSVVWQAGRPAPILAVYDNENFMYLNYTDARPGVNDVSFFVPQRTKISIYAYLASPPAGAATLDVGRLKVAARWYVSYAAIPAMNAAPRGWRRDDRYRDFPPAQNLIHARSIAGLNLWYGPGTSPPREPTGARFYDALVTFSLGLMVIVTLAAVGAELFAVTMRVRGAVDAEDFTDGRRIAAKIVSNIRYSAARYKISTAAARAIGAVARANHDDRSACIVGFLFSTLLCLVETWRIDYPAGWIGMRHDWAIMPYGADMMRWAVDEFDGWTRQGTGSVAYIPNDWIIAAPYGILSALVGGIVLSKATAAAVIFTAAFGTWSLARSYGLSIAARAVAAFFYAASPVLFSKIVSGQLTYLWALALLPWYWATLRRCREREPWRAAIAAGLLAAFISAQAQFVVFCAVIGVVELAAQRRRSGFAAMAIVAGLLVSSQVASVYTLSRGSSSILAQGAYSPQIDWVERNSPNLEQALTLRGYVTHYFEAAWSPSDAQLGTAARIAGGVFFLFCAAGAIRALRAGQSGPCIVWCLGTAGALGTTLPFTVYAFAAIPQLGIFREVYHWAVVPALCDALFLGFAFELVLLGSKAATFVCGGAFALAVLYISPSLSGDFSGNVQVVPLRASLDDAERVIARRANLDRVLWLPIDQPMKYVETRFSGLDPSSHAAPASIFSYVFAPPTLQIASTARFGDPADLARLLRYAGVGAVIDRDDVSSSVLAFSPPVSPQAAGYFSPERLHDVTKRMPWRYERHPDYALSTSPAPNRLVAQLSGFALVSPDVRLLQLVPADESPVMTKPLMQPLSVTYVADDVPAMSTRTCANVADKLTPAMADIGGWLPTSLQWQLHPSLSRLFDTAFIAQRDGASIAIRNVAGGDHVVVAFAQNLDGGNLVVRGPRRNIVYAKNTQGAFGLASADISAAEAGTYTIVSRNRATALRGVYVLSQAEAAHSASCFRSLLAGARRVTVVGSAADRRNAGGSVAARAAQPADTGRGVSQTEGTTGTTIDGTLGTGKILVLRTQNDYGWTLLVDGRPVTQHGIGELYGNAWLLPPSDRPRHYALRFEPSRWIAGLHCLAAAVLVGAMLLAVAAPWRRFAKRTAHVAAPTLSDVSPR